MATTNTNISSGGVSFAVALTGVGSSNPKEPVCVHANADKTPLFGAYVYAIRDCISVLHHGADAGMHDTAVRTALALSHKLKRPAYVSISGSCGDTAGLAAELVRTASA